MFWDSGKCSSSTKNDQLERSCTFLHLVLTLAEILFFLCERRNNFKYVQNLITALHIDGAKVSEPPLLRFYRNFKDLYQLHYLHFVNSNQMNQF